MKQELENEVSQHNDTKSDQEQSTLLSFVTKDDYEAEVKRHMDTKAILQQEQTNHEETRKKLDLEVQRNNQNAKANDTKSIVEEEAIQLSGAKELQG